MSHAPDFESDRETRQFSTLEAYSAATGQDRHSINIDFTAFVGAPEPDFSDPTIVVRADTIDLRLKRGSVAIDAGTELPGITDHYNGAAPDLGAYEFGADLPHYGPRPQH